MRYLIYRISSKSSAKTRIEQFDKVWLLQDTIKKFPDFYPIVVADNCSDELLQQIKAIDAEFIVTNLGNSRALLFSIKYSLARADSGDSLYFCEDDYWHQDDLTKYIDEGLSRFDYITLFDHPDKYDYFSDYDSPSRNGRFSEITQVVQSDFQGRFWRLTSSTTGTFAANYDVLAKDLWIFDFFCKRRLIAPDLIIWHSLTRGGFKANSLRQWCYLWFAKNILSLGRMGRHLGVLQPSGAVHLEPRAIPKNFQLPAK